MPVTDRLDLGPLVGALMNAYRTGESVNIALERLRADLRYRRFDEVDFQRALVQAQRNQQALLALRVVRPQLTAEEAFAGRILPTDLVGYRVSIVILDAAGNEQTKQVTVNAPARDPLPSILRRARDFVFTDAARRKGSWQYPVQIALDAEGEEQVEVFAVVEGGFPGPALGPPQVRLR